MDDDHIHASSTGGVQLSEGCPPSVRDGRAPLAGSGAPAGGGGMSLSGGGASDLGGGARGWWCRAAGACKWPAVCHRLCSVAGPRCTRGRRLWFQWGCLKLLLGPWCLPVGSSSGGSGTLSAGPTAPKLSAGEAPEGGGAALPAGWSVSLSVPPYAAGMAPSSTRLRFDKPRVRFPWEVEGPLLLTRLRTRRDRLPDYRGDALVGLERVWLPRLPLPRSAHLALPVVTRV